MSHEAVVTGYGACEWYASYFIDAIKHDYTTMMISAEEDEDATIESTITTRP